MNFYHILFGLKHGFNKNLTWYENLFVKFYNNTIAKLVAKILSIKGNTISFNQLVQNGNFADTSLWNVNTDTTFSVANNEASITRNLSGTGARGIYQYKNGWFSTNHYYYISVYAKSSSITSMQIAISDDVNYTYVQNFGISSSYTKIGYIFQQTRLDNTIQHRLFFRTNENGTFNLKNVMCFDLTLMGIDNLTTTAEVENWLSTHLGNIPYFNYTEGTLISFNGTGLKTENADQTESNTLSLPTQTYFPDGMDDVGTAHDELLPTDAYKRVARVDLGNLEWTYETVSVPSKPYFYSNVIPNTDSQVGNVICSRYITDTRVVASMSDKSCKNVSGRILLVDSSYTDANSLKSSLSGLYLYYGLSTPLHNYGVVDLGTLDWTYENVSKYFYAIVDGKAIGNFNLFCSMFVTTSVLAVSNMSDKQIKGNASLGSIYVKDSSYTSADTFATAVSGCYLYYEAETPVAPSLDLSYPIQWGGTEQILPTNTSTPTTTGILADIHYPDGDRTDQAFVYRVIEKAQNLGNRALSIMLGKKVETENPEEPLNILLKGEK